MRNVDPEGIENWSVKKTEEEETVTTFCVGCSKVAVLNCSQLIGMIN